MSVPWRVKKTAQEGRRRKLPTAADARHDAIAALPSAISSVPDGMASSVLVGVSPAYGLYAGLAGPIAAVALVTTLVATLLLPTAAAVGIGLAVFLLLQLNRESVDLRVIPGGR